MQTLYPFKTAILAIMFIALAGCNQANSQPESVGQTPLSVTDGPKTSGEVPSSASNGMQQGNTTPTTAGATDAPPTPTPQQEAFSPINAETVRAAGFASLIPYWGRSAFWGPNRNLVIRNESEWQTLWAEYTAQEAPPRPLPVIDFSKFMVLGIARGGPNSCYGAGIEKVEQSASGSTVHLWFYTENEFSGGCTASPVSPVHMVLAPQSALPVKFIERSQGAFSIAWSGWPEFQAAPYLQEPVSTQSGSATCTQLVVPFALRNIDKFGVGERPFPPQIKITAVGVTQSEITRWVQAPTETTLARHWITDNDWLHDAVESVSGRKSELILRGTARACVAKNLLREKPVDVVFSVSDGSLQQELRAPEVRIASAL